MITEDWEKVEKTIKPFTDALLKRAESYVEEQSKKKWTSVPEGLKKNFMENAVRKFLSYRDYEKKKIENGIRACFRFNIEFEVRETGLYVLNEKNLPDLEIIRKTCLDLEDKRKFLQDFVWNIYNVERAIPYTPKKEFDVIISVDGVQYKNKEITDLYYSKDKEMKELELERDICLSLFELIENKKIEVK